LHKVKMQLVLIN